MNSIVFAVRRLIPTLIPIVVFATHRGRPYCRMRAGIFSALSATRIFLDYIGTRLGQMAEYSADPFELYFPGAWMASGRRG